LIARLFREALHREGAVHECLRVRSIGLRDRILRVRSQRQRSGTEPRH
jgi:hypothetical protein